MSTDEVHAIPFATQAWGEGLMRRINENEAYARLAATWEGAVVFEDKTLRRWVWLDIHHGHCRGVVAWDSNSPETQKTAPFIFSAKTAVWRQLCEGELRPTTALATRRLKVQGNMMQVMRYAQATIAMVGSAKRVQTAWM